MHFTKKIVEKFGYSTAESIALIRLRFYQHQINELLKAGDFQNIPIHLAFGREAVAVGMDLTMRDQDVLCLSHRNAGFNLARSKSLDPVLKEFRLEQRPGDRFGKMASMNLACDETGIVYTSSILGNNLAVAAGIAMNRKLVKLSGIVFVVTGDGAIEEGVFWETLIFARSHDLKLIVVVENDDHSMSSTIEQRRCPIDLSLICSGLGISYRCADGASLPDIRSALTLASVDALSNNVALIEFNLKTFCQHAGPTPGWPGDPRQISLENGLLLGSDPQDPLIHLRDSIGLGEFERLAEMVMKEGYK